MLLYVNKNLMSLTIEFKDKDVGTFKTFIFCNHTFHYQHYRRCFKTEKNTFHFIPLPAEGRKMQTPFISCSKSLFSLHQCPTRVVLVPSCKGVTKDFYRQWCSSHTRKVFHPLCLCLCVLPHLHTFCLLCFFLFFSLSACTCFWDCRKLCYSSNPRGHAAPRLLRRE